MVAFSPLSPPSELVLLPAPWLRRPRFLCVDAASPFRLASLMRSYVVQSIPNCASTLQNHIHHVLPRRSLGALFARARILELRNADVGQGEGVPLQDRGFACYLRFTARSLVTGKGTSPPTDNPPCRNTVGPRPVLPASLSDQLSGGGELQESLL